MTDMVLKEAMTRTDIPQDAVVAYVSGPISGRKNHNKEAFSKAGKALADKGIFPLLPTDNFHGASISSLRPKYMREDISLLMTSDVVVVLPDWKDSRGARIEVAIAQEIQIPVVGLDLEPISEIVEAFVVQKYDNPGAPVIPEIFQS